MVSNDQLSNEYITKQARAQYPDLFENVANPAFYTFRLETFHDGKEADILQIGLYDLRRNFKDRKPLWARICRNMIVYYFESNSQLHEAKDGALNLYPDSGITRHRNAEAPFNLVAPRNWPSGYGEKSFSRMLARNTLESLIRFAFFLTRRRSGLASQNRILLLEELHQLCENLQRNRGVESKVAPYSATDEEEEESGSAQPLQKQSPPARAPSSLTPHHTKTKRLSEEMDDALVYHGGRKTHDRVFGKGLSPSPRSDDGGSPPTPQHGSSSTEPQNIYETLVQSIMAQKKGE